MKRLWFVLLALGILPIFSTAAFAVDAKFSGQFYAAGLYLDKTSLTKDNGPSTAFYFQRLRVQTDLIATPGVKLVTRFDALERAWGANRSAASTTLAGDSAGTIAENENIAFDWAYVVYNSPIGVFQVGYMEDGSTGTIFGNTLTSLPRIKYAYKMGPVDIKMDITKGKEQSYTAANNTSYYTDADKDKYGLEGVYNWNGGKAGMKVTYYRYCDKRPTSNYGDKYFLFVPYAIAKIGPVDLQAEFNYATGKRGYDNGTADKDIDSYAGWVDATVKLGLFYFGGSVAYVSGDDNANDDKIRDTLKGGRDWSPALIMWSYDRSMWIGAVGSTAAGNAFGTEGLQNGILYQGRVGVMPTDKLDIMASFTYATADKNPSANWVSKDYGYEVDLTGTYKLTSNLTYMLGAGYLWTGDYFKGTSAANQVQNDYMVINKLTLTF